MTTKKFFIAPLILTTFTFGACNSSDSSTSGSGVSQDASVSGTAAGIVGGASLGSSGTASNRSAGHRKFDLADYLSLERSAKASVSCPTVLTASGSGCTQMSATEVALNYTDCENSATGSSLNGVAYLTGVGGNITCGTVPTTLTGLTLGYNLTRTSGEGNEVTIDSTGASNPAWTNANGGVTLSFSGQNRTVTVPGVDISGAKFWHTVTTGSGSGVTLANGVASGSLTTYHNKLKIQGTSSFNDVVYNSTCCTPVSGTITTTFSAIPSVTPTAAGAVVIAAGHETLTFTSCGNATYSGPDGTSGSVTVDACY